MPIIKLSLLPSPGLPFGIACDIGFENRLALENTRLLLTYATVDPARVRTMVLFVKVWSKRRRINSPYRGTLSCVYSPPFLVCRSVGAWVWGSEERGGRLGGRGSWQLTSFFLCIAPPPSPLRLLPLPLFVTLVWDGIRQRAQVVRIHAPRALLPDPRPAAVRPPQPSSHPAPLNAVVLSERKRRARAGTRGQRVGRLVL